MKNKAIVLVHGLYMKKTVMLYLKISFEKKGFKVYNFEYKTLEYKDKTLEDFHDFIKNINEKSIYFVGHSMGGLLIRNYFNKKKPIFNDTAIITLGTPHKGSSLGKKIENSVFDFTLGTSPYSGVTNGLEDWGEEYPLGCIIGTMNIGPNNIFNSEKDQGDGTVLCEEAFAENATDIIRVRSNHTGLVYSKKVLYQCLFFIKNKRFN